VIRTGGVRSLLINGKVVASDEVGDMQHEYLLGHLPTLLHPAPKSAVVIGLGAGLTLGGVAADESLERIVVVEIEPAVEGAAQLFADLHDDALSDPRVERVWQDGRNYLATTSQRFDVITADPIHPWAQGAAYLYTTEYYAIVASRLAPGGVACQWLPLYELSEDDLKSVIAAFVANFDHASLWQATGDLLLIGSDSPIRVDLDQLAARIARPRAARQLARAGLDDPLSLLAEFNMDRDAMQRFSRGAIVNTDDNLYLEYSSPLSIGIHPGRHLPRFDRTRATAIAVVRDRGSRFASDEELASALDDLRAAKSRTLQAAPQWHQVHAAPTAEGLAALAAEYREALALGPYRHAALLLAHSEAWSGELALERGDSEGAMEFFRSAFAADPGSVTANLQLGLEASSRGQPRRALSHFERAAARDPLSVAAQTAAAQTLMQLGRFADARQRLRLAIALRPEVAALHRLECRCLRRLGQLTAAVETCRTARRLTLEAGEARP
jgi:spermidine synthase